MSRFPPLSSDTCHNSATDPFNFSGLTLSENYHFTLSTIYAWPHYQYIGYLKGKDMVVLKPQRGAEFFRDGEAVKPDERMKELEKEAVYYYQHASGWRTSLKE